MVNRIKEFTGKLLVTDAIVIAYCFLQIIYVYALGSRLPDRPNIAVIYLSCLTVSVLFVYIRGLVKNKFIRAATLLYPIILFIPLYEVSGHQVHMFFTGFFDNYIIDFERAIFSIHPTIWMQKFDNPWVTEWMMFGYTFYVMLIPITTGWLYSTHNGKAWQHMLGALIISFFTSYFIFSLLPVEGPRFALAEYYTVSFNGYFFKTLTEILENRAMLHGGAFPSAHCSAATVMLLLSFKYDKRLFWWVAPIIITLYIATVYGRYHYPTDVIGGMITGISGIMLYHPLSRFWDRLVNNFKSTRIEGHTNRNIIGN